MNDWSLPTGPTPIPMLCELNNNRSPCTVTNATPLTISITKPANVNVINSNIIDLRLTSEFIGPKNGMVYPTNADNYKIEI